MSHRPAKIRPPLCEYPVGLRPPGYSQSGISNTLHMYSINVLIYANDNKFNCKKLFVKNRKILIDIHTGTGIKYCCSMANTSAGIIFVVSCTFAFAVLLSHAIQSLLRVSIS